MQTKEDKNKYMRKYLRDWRKSPKGKELNRKAQQKYRKTKKGADSYKRSLQKWKKSPKGVAAVQKYNHSLLGKENLRRNHIKKNYNMDIDGYDKMFKDQYGRCAICSDPPENDRHLCVDHNHVSGDVRGLLCDRCNTILGYCNDCTTVLQEAVKYLIKYNKILETYGVHRGYCNIRIIRNTYKGKESRRNSQLKFKYNMSITDYNNLCNEQHNKCAICFGPPTRNNFSVDHSHRTDQIRGLLCDTCNLMLGHSEDSVLLLQKAIHYLERYSYVNQSKK